MGLKARIVVADDEAPTREVLSALLQGAGYQVQTAADGAAALRYLQAAPFDLLITDLMMPHLDGLELLAATRGAFPGLPVVLITAHGSVETAVSAMKEGAFDFITKPFDNDAILETVKKALRAGELREQDLVAAAPLKDASALSRLIGHSPAITRVVELVKQVAPTDSTVLLQGETGTGKELIARAIHQQSPRRKAPFVALNCACLPEHLAESELFGHEKGAFTGAQSRRPGRFELADGGTLFLDEVTELSHSAQSKLLRVLQEQTFERVGGVKTISVDVRLISASSEQLKDVVESGNFRQDLYYRLHVIPIELPPLRDRTEDIAPLFEHFVESTAAQLGKPAPSVDPGLIGSLDQHRWEGNIRELQNLAERMLVLAHGDSLTKEDLPREILGEEPLLPAAPAADSLDLKAVSEQAAIRAQCELIRRTLKQTDGNVTRAAQLLGVSRSTLQAKMKDYGLRE